MSNLWIYGRKPAATVRYRHGGFNATFPMNGHTVIEQAGLERERAAHVAAIEAAEREHPPRPDGFDAQNVLSFPERASRAKRGTAGPSRPGPPRPGKRPAPYRD